MVISSTGDLTSLIDYVVKCGACMPKEKQK